MTIDEQRRKSRPTITLLDMGRLLAEQNESRVHPRDWFEREGIDKVIFELLVQAARTGFPELMMEGMVNDDDPQKIMSDMCATFMLSGFSLGWETHKQYGGGPTG